jgi:hypothetical protein
MPAPKLSKPRRAPVLPAVQAQLAGFDFKIPPSELSLAGTISKSSTPYAQLAGV